MDQLKSAIETQQPVLSIVPSDVTDSEFNPEQLSKIANMIPSLHCECPNHIAKLLIDINGFEQYCRECETTTLNKRLYTLELGRLTAQARMIFEGALKAVAVADNLDLDSML